MASYLAFGLLVALSNVWGSFCTQFQVEWTLGVNPDYTKWASSNKLKVGDSILFSYQAETHSVYQVSETDYNACRTTKPIKTYSDGNSVVNLETDSPYYFVCGVESHCSAGMKLAVTAVASSSSSPVAPISAPTSSPASTPSIAPSRSPKPSSPSLAPAPSPSTSSPVMAPSSSIPSPVIAPSISTPSSSPIPAPVFVPQAGPIVASVPSPTPTLPPSPMPTTIPGTPASSPTGNTVPSAAVPGPPGPPESPTPASPPSTNLASFKRGGTWVMLVAATLGWACLRL